MESIGQSIWDGYLSNVAGSEEPDGVVLGIDFGSSNSCVAVWRADKNKVKIIRNSSSAAAKITPSLIQFNEAFKGYKIGNECDASMDNVISNLKALVLHPETEISAGQDNHASPHSPWVDGTTLKCFDRPADGPNSAQDNAISVDKRTGKIVPVEELVGFILSYLKDCAEDYLTRRPIKKFNAIDGSVVETTTHYTNTASTSATSSTATSDAAATSATPVLRAEVHRVVLGVPVNCTEKCKQSLKSAAQLAGFTEVHFLVESTAAATAYGLTVSGKKNVLVFDMGGGTTDLSVLHIDNGRLTVQATGGNNTLGGKNVDALLLDLVLNKVQELSEEKQNAFKRLSRTHLLALCRACKEELSTEQASTISIPYQPSSSITTNSTTNPPTTISASVTITLSEFEDCVQTVTDLVEATVQHTVKSWLEQQHNGGSSGGIGGSTDACTGGSGGTARAESPVINSEEEEEADGFVRVSPLTVGASGYSDTATDHINTDADETITTTLTSTTPSNESTTTAATTTPTTTVTIDEVVLVGGSSRIPCVRQALRRGLGNLGINPFLDGTKELCTSLHPEEVVAEGLAIRGAVLSGVSGGKLRELLVMDCVNNAIGVMTWENGDDNSSNGSSGTATSTRIFNSILHKGLAIPATNTMRFPLEHVNQKFVSLDIYEEVEECRLKPIKSTPSESEVGIIPTSEEGKNSAYEMVYKYHVVATADVPVPAVDDSSDSGESGSVDISFTMTTDGMLKFNVVRVQSTTSSSASSSNNAIHAQSNMLIVYIVLMFALYLFVKIVLTEVEVNDVTSAGVNAVSDAVSGAMTVVSSASETVGSVATEL